jgi:hypothetical protein
VKNRISCFLVGGRREIVGGIVGISLSGVEHRADFLVRILKENNFGFFLFGHKCPISFGEEMICG